MEKKSINKLIIEKLKDKGVNNITIEYSGGGDSGDIENISFCDFEGNNVDIPTDDDYSAIENFAYYNYLNNIEDWWNNDGGYGEMTINLETLEYTINHNVRYTQYDEYEHNGSIEDNLLDI